MLYAAPRGSSYGNHGQGRCVYAWCNGRPTVLENITNHAPLGRVTRPRCGWRTEAVGASALSLTVLGLLADRDLGYEEPYELTAGPNGLLRAILDVRHAPLQRVKPGLGT